MDETERLEGVVEEIQRCYDLLLEGDPDSAVYGKHNADSDRATAECRVAPDG